jgi:transaldolase
MNPTKRLHELGQSLWLDNITRTMLDDGTIQRYIDDYSVTGLTSNPTIFDHAISSGAYNQEIRQETEPSASAEDVFFALAIDDLRRAADLFSPEHERTDGVDGWVSLELPPTLAFDTAKSVDAAQSLHARAERENIFIKIPGTPEGLPAIEQCIGAGIPVNVTLLFDASQYRAAAQAYLRGVAARVERGLDPVVASVASVFVSRWDVAVAHTVPAELKNQLGLAVAREAYLAYRDVLDSEEFTGLKAAGARAQRLLFASTGTKDPLAPDTLYVENLAAPDTINTMPDATLEAYHDHGELADASMFDAASVAARLGRFADAGVDAARLAQTLQNEGAAAFDKSWHDLLERIDVQRQALS